MLEPHEGQALADAVVLEPLERFAAADGDQLFVVERVGAKEALLRVLFDGEADGHNLAALAPVLGHHADVADGVDLFDRLLDHEGGKPLEVVVHGRLCAHEAAELLQVPPAGALHVLEAHAVLVQREAVAALEALLHADVDGREHLGIVELAGQLADVAVGAEAVAHTGVRQQGHGLPVLAPVLEHVELDDGLLQGAQRGLERGDVLALFPADHVAQVAHGDGVASVRAVRGHQVVVGVQQEDVGDLALDQAQLAGRVDGRDVLLEHRGHRRWWGRGCLVVVGHST